MEEKRKNIESRVDRRNAMAIYCVAFGISFTSGLLLPISKGTICLGMSFCSLNALKYQLHKNLELEQDNREIDTKYGVPYLKK